jgi:FkbM family methyltransferase
MVQSPAKSMKMRYLRLKQRLKQQLKTVVGRIFRFEPGYKFTPAPSIQKQSFSFRYQGHMLLIEADYATPLYETVAEVVDYDCYQLSQVKFSGGTEGIVLDIGAHIGVATVVLAQLHRGRIFCFEPIPRNCEFLEANLRSNNVTTAQVMPSAVTAADGFTTFEVDPNVSVVGHAGHVIKGDPLAFTQTLQVKTISLPSALLACGGAHVELIKMDCEGGEYAIVEQITPEFARRIRNITMEVHDLDRDRNVTTLTERLKSLGYRLLYKKELLNRPGLHHLLASR